MLWFQECDTLVLFGERNSLFTVFRHYDSFTLDLDREKRHIINLVQKITLILVSYQVRAYDFLIFHIMIFVRILQSHVGVVHDGDDGLSFSGKDPLVFALHRSDNKCPDDW